MHKKLFTIAKNTFTETLRQPVYAVIIVAALFLFFISPSLTMYTMSDDNKLLREIGLSTLFLAGLFIAIFSAAGAVTEADQLLSDVMSTRGYPVSDFEQRAADISVDHPLVLENYRTAHEIALRQTQGKASTEDLRQAMVHYRTLFDELVSDPEAALTTAAS